MVEGQRLARKSARSTNSATKSRAGNLRAAYNYEYGLRVRKGLRVAHALASTSVHGVEGVLPVPAGMEKVNVLIPLQAGEGPKKGGTEAGKTGVTRKRG